VRILVVDTLTVVEMVQVATDVVELPATDSDFVGFFEEWHCKGWSWLKGKDVDVE